MNKFILGFFSYFFIMTITLADDNFNIEIGKIFEQPNCTNLLSPTIEIKKDNEIIRKYESGTFVQIDFSVYASGGSLSCLDINDEYHYKNIFFAWRATSGSFINITPTGEKRYSKIRWSSKLSFGDESKIKVYVGNSLGSLVKSESIIINTSAPINNEYIDLLTPRLGLILSNTRVIEGDTVGLILTSDKPLEQAINVNLHSSDSNLTLNNGYLPYTIYLPYGATQSEKINVSIPANRILDDIRNITLSASTDDIVTNTPSVKLRVYENSDSSEKVGKDIELLSGFNLNDVYINQNSLTNKSINIYVKNTSNQNKSVKVKIIRQLGQENILFDSERDCTVFVSAGRTESCSITLRFEAGTPSGQHSLKIVGSASNGSYFTEYKTISVINQLNQYNYSINNPVKSSIQQELGEVLDYGSPVVQGRGNGNCIHQLPYKFYLKSLANNQVTTVSQGYVNVCENDVTLDQQSSIKIDQSGIYQFWAQIYPPLNSDSNTSDNQSKIMTVTVGDSNKADLSIKSLNIPSTIKQNENMSLTLSVNNIGNKISTPTQVSVYSSNNVNNNGSVGSGDQQIATFNVSAISSNYSKSFSKTNISFSQLGNKYIYACVIPIVNEKSTNNNCSTSKKIKVEASEPINNDKVPLAANLVTPSGDINDNTPTYKWNAVATATQYYLYVSDSTGNVKIRKWYSAQDASCIDGLGICSITPSTELALGKATWWIKTWNKQGQGPWSNSINFNVKISEPVETENYQLSLDSDFTVHRSGQLGEDLTWVIEKDGNIVLSRYAKNELEYKYSSNTKGSNFRVWLKKYVDGKYVVVSNIVTYTVEPVVTENYQLSLDSDFTVHRSGQLGEDLTWVIEKDGNIVLSRYAKNELEYKYSSNTKGSNFRVWLKKYVDGGYVVVSNIITYTVQ